MHSSARNSHATTVALVGVAGALALSLTACSSSGTKASTSTTPSTPASTSSSAPAPSTPAPSTPTSTAPAPADAATTAAVKKAYATFFGGTKNQAALIADLQNGDKLTAALIQQSKNPVAATLTATVSTVSLENPHVADVTFTLLSKGAPLLSNTPGKAVLVDGTWKLAAETFCGLVAASGTTPAACTDQSVVALPSS